MKPRLAYVVCATQRSGSTVLCETLRATGIAGAPLEHFELLRHSGRPRQPREYFGEEPPAGVAALLPPAEPAQPAPPEAPAQWWERIVRAGSTPNGVWGGKLMWDHVGDLTARAGALAGVAGADLSQLLDRLLGDVLLVHVRREDTVAQAVSLWKALQTQSWRHDSGQPDAPVAYHHGAIEYLAGLMERHDAAWQQWFADTGREPLTLVYEQIRDDPREGVAQILQALGLPCGELPEPALARQRDGTSREWAQRYREERAGETAAAVAEQAAAEAAVGDRSGAAA